MTIAGHKKLTRKKAGQLLRQHLGLSGGASGVASGKGSVGSGRTARSIAQSFAGFVGQVANVGLAEALRRNGLPELVGRSAQETLLGILNLCGGSDGSIDAVDARNAFSRTMDELCADAMTADEIEEDLVTLTDGAALVELLMTFFGNYLYEHFCRIFFKQLIQKHGEQRASSFLADILDYIKSNLRGHTIDRDATGIDWFGEEGDRLCAQIMQDTLTVFEG